MAYPHLPNPMLPPIPLRGGGLSSSVMRFGASRADVCRESLAMSATTFFEIMLQSEDFTLGGSDLPYGRGVPGRLSNAMLYASDHYQA